MAFTVGVKYGMGKHIQEQVKPDLEAQLKVCGRRFDMESCFD